MVLLFLYFQYIIKNLVNVSLKYCCCFLSKILLFIDCYTMVTYLEPGSHVKSTAALITAEGQGYILLAHHPYTHVLVKSNTDRLEWWGMYVGDLILPWPPATSTTYSVQLYTTILVYVESEERKQSWLMFNEERKKSCLMFIGVRKESCSLRRKRKAVHWGEKRKMCKEVRKESCLMFIERKESCAWRWERKAVWYSLRRERKAVHGGEKGKLSDVHWGEKGKLSDVHWGEKGKLSDVHWGKKRKLSGVYWGERKAVWCSMRRERTAVQCSSQS